MIIIIEETINGKFIPNRKFVFFKIRIYKSEFHNKHACLQWVRKIYAPKSFKSRSSTYLKKNTVYQFFPERRDEIDIQYM